VRLRRRMTSVQTSKYGSEGPPMCGTDVVFRGKRYPSAEAIAGMPKAN